MPLKKVNVKSKKQEAADVLNTIRDPCPFQCSWGDPLANICRGYRISSTSLLQRVSNISGKRSEVLATL
jgi:hypothetical protein